MVAKVSFVESDATPHQALAEAERATASLWVDYPPTPAWYCPAAGAWHAGFVLAVGGLYESPAWLAISMSVLTSLLAGFTAWYTRYRGAAPRVRSAPAEFTTPIMAYMGAWVTAVAVIAAVSVMVDYRVGAVVAFMLVTSVFYVYEWAYAAAAAATRERLG